MPRAHSEAPTAPCFGFARLLQNHYPVRGVGGLSCSMGLENRDKAFGYDLLHGMSGCVGNYVGFYKMLCASGYPILESKVIKVA